jgi:hemerythrin superfamily protein
LLEWIVQPLPGMNAIDMLKAQHREVESLFEKLEGASDDEQREAFIRLADALSVHAIIEERHFYPAVRARDTERLLDESLTDHLQMKSLIAALVDCTVDDPDWEPLCQALRTETEHHVRREESTLFPAVEAMMEEVELDMIGSHMQDTAEELEAEGSPHEQVSVEIEVPNI